ncbi:MAG: branched-chain amino acid ABC transporter permease [Alphaproteobacteria bacterium]|nr:branched-chain amino acid ABC transporter permease [Alphaproteobacteria bacterium]
MSAGSGTLRQSRAIAGLLGLAVLGFAIFPWLGGEYYIDLLIKVMILGIFAMSLDLLIGYTGLISFGHAAFFGLTGYVLVMVTPEAGSISVWLALPACLIAAALVAVVIGWMSIRTSGIYFIMLTLALAQMLYYFFNDSTRYGGSDGTFIASRPSVSIGSLRLLDLSDRITLYYVVLASLVGTFVLLLVLLRAPFGQVIQAIRANEARTRALGFAVQNYKLASFVIAGALAGFAGFLEATHTGIISPAHLSWHESGMVMIMVILGGMGTLYGAVLGAFILVFLQEFLQDMTEHWQLAMGLVIIVVVLVLPKGVAGMIKRLESTLGNRHKARVSAVEAGDG